MTISLKNLLGGVTEIDVDIEAGGITIDSRAVSPNDVFAALAGTKEHGLTHAQQAIAAGAAAIIYEANEESVQLAKSVKGVPLFAVTNLNQQLGELAARVYDNPSRFLSIIGITGTNGKTSCSHFLAQMLNSCGIIGTLGWGKLGQLHKTVNTTPDAVTIQRMLAQLHKENLQTVAMEVSSHGLEQGRVNGIEFTGAVFTNISRDHLDYHGSMDAYLQAKLALLQKPNLKFVVINIDDAYSKAILAACPKDIELWSVSSQGKTTAKGKNLVAYNKRAGDTGIDFDVSFDGQIQTLSVPLYGDFNIDNCLCVLAVMLAKGVSLSEAAAKLHHLKPVAGRMERFGGGVNPLVFVDYAHTPDALQKVLQSVRQHCLQTVWVIFGCGGNRDKGKRPHMGGIAEQWADQVVITDDNPRFEDSRAIINDILEGCTADAQANGRVQIIADRTKAIQTVLTHAKVGDCVVIAGKGHEQYQECQDVKIAFSDRNIVIAALAARPC